jgi:hypothetical protein
MALLFKVLYLVVINMTFVTRHAGVANVIVISIFTTAWLRLVFAYLVPAGVGALLIQRLYAVQKASYSL